MKSQKRIDLRRIEGIGQVFETRFREQGIRTVESFLDAAADRPRRQKLAQRMNIPDTLILEWANLADLMRVKGVGEEYSQLLEAAGVDSPLELRNRRADHLHAKLIEINTVKKYVRRLPSLDQVKIWIDEAKNLAQVVTH
jgi:predicted flap endonuclease-1-like 5' DNA nuclease